ncbi:hypothetical protein SLS57_011357 [Botryosphaeria dothidea]
MASPNEPPTGSVHPLASTLSYEHFLVITLHSSSSSASVSADFLTWLEIHAVIPYLRLFQHPSILAPAGPHNPQTLRCVVGVARQQEPDSQSQQYGDGGLERDKDDATRSTRLTCGLQAFLKQLRLHPRFLETSGLWLNARYVTRADLGDPESFVEFTSAKASNEDIARAPDQQHESPLPVTALSAIGAALRIAPEPNSPPAIVPHSTLQPTAQDSVPSAAGVSRSKAKLRPVADVLDRLRWDESLGGTAAYVVGYRDRFDGVLELSLDRWVAESTAEEWIPLHRVSYVKRHRDGTLVWWREGRLDLIFGSGSGTCADSNAQG